MAESTNPSVLNCGNCGNQPPERSRYCNMCGQSLTGEAPKPPVAPSIEYRWIYIDLFDLKLPGYLPNLAARAEVASHIYERFTPFADEGWEWTVHPADPRFSGWLYQDYMGNLKLAGAELLCKRVRVPEIVNAADTHHHLSGHRLRQLSQRPWQAPSTDPHNRATG